MLSRMTYISRSIHVAMKVKIALSSINAWLLFNKSRRHWSLRYPNQHRETRESRRDRKIVSTHVELDLINTPETQLTGMRQDTRKLTSSTAGRFQLNIS
jgi:hypothetical protein